MAEDMDYASVVADYLEKMHSTCSQIELTEFTRKVKTLGLQTIQLTAIGVENEVVTELIDQLIPLGVFINEAKRIQGEIMKKIEHLQNEPPERKEELCEEIETK